MGVIDLTSELYNVISSFVLQKNNFYTMSMPNIDIILIDSIISNYKFSFYKLHNAYNTLLNISSNVKSFDDIIYTYYNKGIIFYTYDNTQLSFFFEEKKIEFIAWNSQLLDTIICSNITKDSVLEAEYLENNFTGYAFKPNDYIITNIVAPVEGEIMFNGRFWFYFSNGQVSDIEISGIRLVIITFFPNSLREELKKEVVISTTIHGKEQRKLVNDKVYLVQILRKDGIDTNQSKFIYTLKFGYDKIVLFPYFSEVFTSNDLTYGSNTLTINENLDDYPLFKNKSPRFILIVNKHDEFDFFASYVDDINGNVITMRSNFNANYSDCYIYFGDLFTISKVDVQPESSDKVSVELEVVEYVY